MHLKILGVFIGILFFLVGCGSGQSSPEEVIETFFKSVQEDDFETS